MPHCLFPASIKLNFHFTHPDLFILSAFAMLQCCWRYVVIVLTPLCKHGSDVLSCPHLSSFVKAALICCFYVSKMTMCNVRCHSETLQLPSAFDPLLAQINPLGKPNLTLVADPWIAYIWCCANWHLFTPDGETIGQLTLDVIFLHRYQTTSMKPLIHMG